jgi:plastocyanin
MKDMEKKTMKTKINILIVIGLVCICSNFMFPLADGKAAEEQYVGQEKAKPGEVGKEIFPDKKLAGSRVITIPSEAMRIPTVTVDAGTTVIWINNSRYYVEINFKNKQVTLACESPVNFVVDEEGKFISNKIPFGAVASLCFIQKGEYDYIVRRASSGATPGSPYTRKELTGKIIVK